MQIINDFKEVHTTSDGFAGCVNLTRQRINQLVKESVLVKDKNGKMPLIENIKKYLEYKLRETDQADYWEEKALHEKAKREMAEIQLAKIQNNVHDAGDVERVMSDMLVAIRTRLLGLGSSLASQLANKEKPFINDVIDNEIQEILDNLKDYEPEMFTQEEIADEENE